MLSDAKWEVPQTAHFIGVGGVGMSAIALTLLSRGVHVTGSDVVDSDVTRRLRDAGANVRIGHSAEAVAKLPTGGSAVVVVSSAISEENPERQAARRRGLPLWHRSQALAALMGQGKSVAVAGSHGKTTTSLMVGNILTEAGLDPTVLVGGWVEEYNGGARVGRPDLVVAEVDESDGSFLNIRPDVAVVTNVDFDHPDHFADACDVQRAFAQFLNQAPGVVAVVDADDAGVQATLLLTCARAVRCVLSETTTDASAQARAFHVQADWDGSRFRVEYQGRDLGAVRLNVGGRHNVRNALLAIVAGLECGAEFTAAARALERFRGVRRRFDLRGEAAGVRVYDDYAHHPREIEATLEVAAQLRHREGRRVVVVFQPHRYTRTRALADAFGRAFHEADVLVLTDVYAAGDKPIDGVDGRLIAEAARNAGHTDVDYCPRLQQVCDALGPRLRPGDVVLTLGAGDVTSLGPALLDWLRGKEGA